MQSFSMIIVSEVGDKTFLIAAILAMRHPRAVVFAGAFGSLVVMSILSAAMGHILPTLIPIQWTQFAAAILFLVFGVKMVIEGKNMEGGSGKIEEEIKEVEEELEAANGGLPLQELEEGVRKRRLSDAGPRTGAPAGVTDGAKNFFSLLLGPVFVQSFVLTFLGEWGDRSQIATIALGAAHNVYLVTLGTIVGHACCTAVAVLGGRWISTKISVKKVTLGGACLFLLFAAFYFYEVWMAQDEMLDSIRRPSQPSASASA